MESSILLYSNKLLKILCFENISEFNVLNKQGSFLDINKCHICGNKFEKNKNQNDKIILIFNCGHKMHFLCSKTEKKENKEILIWPICKKKEIDLDIFNLNEREIKETEINEIKKEKKLNKDNIDINMYRDGFIRMNDINKNMINKNKSFLNDCIKAKERIQYAQTIKNISKKKIKTKKWKYLYFIFYRIKL